MTPVLLALSCRWTQQIYRRPSCSFLMLSRKARFSVTVTQCEFFPSPWWSRFRTSREDWKEVGDVADLSKSATHKRQGMLGTCR